MQNASIYEALDGYHFVWIEPALLNRIENLRQIDVVVAESPLLHAKLRQSDVEWLVRRLEFGMFASSSLTLTFFSAASLLSCS